MLMISSNQLSNKGFDVYKTQAFCLCFFLQLPVFTEILRKKKSLCAFFYEINAVFWGVCMKISAERKKELLCFCKERNLKFHDLELLDLAFHHSSFSNENPTERSCAREITISTSLLNACSTILSCGLPRRWEWT